MENSNTFCYVPDVALVPGTVCPFRKKRSAIDEAPLSNEEEVERAIQPSSVQGAKMEEDEKVIIEIRL